MRECTGTASVVLPDAVSGEIRVSRNPCLAKSVSREIRDLNAY